MSSHETHRQPFLPIFDELNADPIVASANEVDLPESPMAAKQWSDNEPDSTDYYLREVGGGGRKETAAVDPPRWDFSISKPVHKKPGGRSKNEGSDSELDPNWNVPIPTKTEEQEAITQRGITKARRAIATHHTKRLTERADNDARRALALSRADLERRKA
jgi:hypothetical protein